MNLNQNIEHSASSSSSAASNDIIADLQAALKKAFKNLNQIQGQNQIVDKYKKQYIEALINCYKHMYASTTNSWVRYTLLYFQQIFGEECIDIPHHPEFTKSCQHIFKIYTPLILNSNIINSIFCLDTILQDISDLSDIHRDNTDKNFIFKEAKDITNKILTRIEIYKNEIETINNFIKLFVDNKIKPIGVENFINCTKIIFAIVSDNKKFLKDSGKYDEILVGLGIILNKMEQTEIEQQINAMAATGSFSDAQIQSAVFAIIIRDFKPHLQNIYESLPLKEILNVTLFFLNSNQQYFTALFHEASKEFNNKYGITLEEFKTEGIENDINIKIEDIAANNALNALKNFRKKATCLSFNKKNKNEKDPNAMAAIIALKNLCVLNNKVLINSLKDNFSKKESKDISWLIDATNDVLTDTDVKSINSITISEIEKKWQDKMGLNNTLIKHLYEKLNSLDNCLPDAIITIKKQIIDIAWKIYEAHDFSIRITKLVINTQLPLKTTNPKSSKFIEIVLEALTIYTDYTDYTDTQGLDLHITDIVLQMEEHHNLINALHESYSKNEPQIQNDLHMQLLALPDKYKHSHLDNDDILAEILEIAEGYKKNNSLKLSVNTFDDSSKALNYSQTYNTYADFSLGEEVDTFDTYTINKDGPRALVTFSSKPSTAINAAFPRSTSSNNLNIITSNLNIIISGQQDKDDDDAEYSPIKLRKNNATPFNSDDQNDKNDTPKPWL